jgi:exosortase
MPAARLERPPTQRAAALWQQSGTLVPLVIAGLAFLVLYGQPMQTLLRDWWTDPEAGHGLLLAPLAVWLAWQRGRAPAARAQPVAGLCILIAAVLLRYVSGLAAELFTMRLSLLGAAAAVIVMHGGLRQLVHWWLPATLLALSVPVPSVVLGSLALPLQLLASKMGAALLVWRDVPVRLSGNVIHIPGQSLFVTEACSGLRSLTALLALGVLIGGLWLRHPVSRIVLLALAIPVAVLLNGVRVFLTGFLVYFVDPAFGEGFMHATEGWVVFVVAFLILGAVAWLLARLETLGDSGSRAGMREAT